MINVFKDWETVFNSINDPISIHDKDYRLILVNKAFSDMLKKTSNELIGRKCYEVIHDTSEPWHDCPHCLTLRTENSCTREFYEPNLGIYLQVSTSPVYDDKGNILGSVHIAKNISEKKKVENALRNSEEKYRALVESTEDSIYVVDRNYRYLFVNKKHKARMGLSEDDLLGRAFSEFHSPEDTKWFEETVNKIVETGQSIQHEHKSSCDGGYFLLTLSPIKEGDGSTESVIVVSKDITELKRMEVKLQTLSLTDELTGLYNRRGFFTLAEQQIKMANRNKSGIFLLYADLDNLKGINDKFGHKEGDAALIEAAGILKESYRESDIIARIGGDEFAVIPVGTSLDNIEIIKIRFYKNLETYNRKRNSANNLSVSIGISYYDPLFPCSIDELMAQADKRMYEQKRHRKKTILR
jgi:diguanylate cyclase (GGDEF)-like protein/PAS domain S-box-containing protein